jgi:hypothetical protein
MFSVTGRVGVVSSSSSHPARSVLMRIVGLWWSRRVGTGKRFGAGRDRCDRLQVPSCACTAVEHAHSLSDVLDVHAEDALKPTFKDAQTRASQCGGAIRYISGSVTDRAFCAKACAKISAQEKRFECVRLPPPMLGV